MKQTGYFTIFVCGMALWKEKPRGWGHFGLISHISVDVSQVSVVHRRSILVLIKRSNWVSVLYINYSQTEVMHSRARI